MQKGGSHSVLSDAGIAKDEADRRLKEWEERNPG